MRRGPLQGPSNRSKRRFTRLIQSRTTFGRDSWKSLELLRYTCAAAFVLGRRRKVIAVAEPGLQAVVERQGTGQLSVNVVAA